MSTPLSENEVYCRDFREDTRITWRIAGKEKIVVEYFPEPRSKHQALRRNPEDWAEDDDDLDTPEDERRDVAGPEGVTWSEVRLDEASLPLKTKEESTEKDEAHPVADDSVTDDDIADDLDPDDPIQPPEEQKKSKKRRRGKGSEQRRQTKRRAPPAGQTAAEANFPDVSRGLRLRTTYLRAANFSLLTNSRVTTTGWNGLPPSKPELQTLRQRYRDGSIAEDLRKFHQVPFDLSSKSATALNDSMDRTFALRTTPADFLAKVQDELYQAMHTLMEPSLSNDSVKRECELKNPRGDHFQCLLGHQRPYHDAIILVKWHKDNQERVKDFLDQRCVQDLIAWVNWLLRAFFPEIADRYERCAKWHQRKYGITPQFGLFWNFCINGIFPNQPRIHTEPHADPKNVVGVCVIFVYLIPGFKFNHKVRSWFVIWDAGVIIELPPWVAFFYPSSLFIHFNCDISDIEIIHTVDGSRPTHGSSRKSRQGGFIGPELPSDAHGRGSIVFFSQGNLFSSAETDYPTLGAARRAGLPGTTDIAGNFDKYYAPYGTFVPA